jgi:putative DNA primase/helicase
MLPAAVPQALYRYTDQANAERLQIMYRSWLISVAGDFYAWDGKRWKLDDGLAQRFACDLSRIVNQERNEVAAQLKALEASGVEGIGDKFVQLEAEVKALTGWAAKCENVATQNAALHLLRKLLNVPVEKIDASPWLLNVENGTVDLRTGVLSPHDPANLITKLAPMSYDPTATAPRFKKFLGEIVQGDTEVVDFMQRWYGYAATGDAREQKLLIKHGPGGNGKSTLGDAIDSVLGEYTSPATLGLLTGKAGANDTAHLAEIADLRGRRLVTASESEDGAKLKEALLKQLTGGDTLKGKRLYGQLFSFRPTHKLELLTNHKPVIKGSDFSIWRRIMLLNFPVKFGTAAEVARGDAMAVRDPTLPAALKAEGPGILAWVVEGTRLWLANGLAPPKAVLDASAEYRQSQDHIAEFLAESCTLDPEAKQPLPALYQAYKAWCHAAGRDYPVTRQRLVDELERRVPRFLRPDPSRRTAQGSYVMGLKLASED